jgi:hypothetical protein
LQLSWLPLMVQPAGRPLPETDNPVGMLYVSVEPVLASGPLLVSVKTIGTVAPLEAVAGAEMAIATSAPWFTVIVLVSLEPPPSGVAVTLSVPCVRVRSSTSNARVCPAASVMPEHVTVPGPSVPTATVELQLPTGTEPVPM